MKHESSQQPETKTSAPAKEAYLFAGAGEYEPITIEASSIEEATKEWERKRAPIRGEELSIEN